MFHEPQILDESTIKNLEVRILYGTFIFAQAIIAQTLPVLHHRFMLECRDESISQSRAHHWEKKDSRHTGLRHVWSMTYLPIFDECKSLIHETLQFLHALGSSWFRVASVWE